jgi:hypothetical protein
MQPFSVANFRTRYPALAARWFPRKVARRALHHLRIVNDFRSRDVRA